MTGEQYVRANKRVYNVVIILLAVMTILSVMACLAEFKITILLQTAAAVAGIIVGIQKRVGKSCLEQEVLYIVYFFY